MGERTVRGKRSTIIAIEYIALTVVLALTQRTKIVAILHRKQFSPLRQCRPQGKDHDCERNFAHFNKVNNTLPTSYSQRFAIVPTASYSHKSRAQNPIWEFCALLFIQRLAAILDIQSDRAFLVLLAPERSVCCSG